MAPECQRLGKGGLSQRSPCPGGKRVRTPQVLGAELELSVAKRFSLLTSSVSQLCLCGEQGFRAMTLAVRAEQLSAFKLGERGLQRRPPSPALITHIPGSHPYRLIKTLPKTT